MHGKNKLSEMRHYNTLCFKVMMIRQIVEHSNKNKIQSLPFNYYCVV